MSESKPQWAPGGWKVCELDRRAVVESGNDLVIADVRDWRNPANAHLIAAAPDLYARLESLIQRCEEMDWPDAELDEDRRALAKARGEEADHG